MKLWKSSGKYRIVFLGLLYGLTRLLNLTGLPIFNDEAIYLDWGVRMWNYHEPFLSLYDGKPPLLMWVFGTVVNIFTDPLLAGRLVSVVAGGLTLTGIYVLSKELYDDKIALAASAIYCLAPLFVFFDRQALMESAIAAMGVWTLILTLRLIKNPSFAPAFGLAMLWAGGIWIKTNAVVFVMASMLLMTTKKDKKVVLGYGAFALGLMLIMLLPLVAQKDAIKILDLNSRFSLSIGEILKLPVDTWLGNLRSVIEIGWWQVGLLMWLPVLKWVYKSKKSTADKRMLLWVGTLILVYAALSKVANPRYLVSFLPILAILMARATDVKKSVNKIALVASLGVFVVFDGLLVAAPVKYFEVLEKVTVYSQARNYLTGFASGYGVKPAIDYVIQEIGPKDALVGIRLDAGNPESAVSLYMSKHTNIQTVYFDERSVELPKENDINLSVPMYYVARDENFAGVERFLILEKKFDKPDGSNVGIYRVRSELNN